MLHSGSNWISSAVATLLHLQVDFENRTCRSQTGLEEEGLNEVTLSEAGTVQQESCGGRNVVDAKKRSWLKDDLQNGD